MAERSASRRQRGALRRGREGRSERDVPLARSRRQRQPDLVVLAARLEEVVLVERQGRLAPGAASSERERERA